MKVIRICEKMKIAESNRLESYNRAFAARTNSECARHTEEGKRYSDEWMRLLGQIDRAICGER